MKINQDTFCGAPWFQIRNRQDMTKSVCCVVEMADTDPGTELMSPLEYLNSPKIKNMKMAMANGVKIPQCKECWDKEKTGDHSYRQQINSFLQGKWLDVYLKNKKDYNTDMVLMADIKIGNTCNFACVMCNPSDSSMIYNSWVKQKDQRFVKEYIDDDESYFEKAKRNGYKQTTYRDYIESIINNKHIKIIKMLGGEPLLDQKLIQMLADLPQDRKNKLKLEIITNGSHDMNAFTERLGEFKSIQWNISLEGIESSQDYARYGSNWNEVEKNILAKREKTDDLSVLSCLQATTITKLHNLINWTNTHDIPFQLGELTHPDYLTMSAVPNELKETTLENLSKVGTYTVSETREFKALDIKSLIDFINISQYNKSLHHKFMEYIAFYEKGKIIPNFLDVFEEWSPYFEV